MRFGYFLSSEEYPPDQLIEQAQLAEEAGFTALTISDHFHPWNDAQGQSPLVWSMIGALSQATSLPITTAVTCPIMRMHPAVVAQAAATSAVLTKGRFVLGVGTGEALNEHIIGHRWPNAEARLEMLEEAVEVMRLLWTGEPVNHRGRHYRVENARIYTRTEEPPKVYVSAFGPRAMELATRIGDGYISTRPEEDLVRRFREGGGGRRPTVGLMKGCYAASREEAVGIAHRLWATSGLPGELSQLLPTPRHFEQAASLVTEDMTGKALACGPDSKAHLEFASRYHDAGFDELHVAAIGPHYRELIALYRDEVLPALA